LVQGVDVWINTPRRPWEASGTSGMKVLVNGGINVSELDGWWAEAYAPEVGWALGDGQEHADDTAWDAIEANDLYDKLEREVIPEFFARAEQGIPTAWVARMRESMARLTPQVFRQSDSARVHRAALSSLCRMPTRSTSQTRVPRFESSSMVRMP
jgi:starch phosphorylase